VNKASYHHLSRSCDHARRYPLSTMDTNAADSDPSSPSTLYDRDSSLNPLTVEQRWAIIAFHKDGQKREDIAKKIPCSIKTVHHWITQYNQHRTVADKHRSGRKRITDENTNINIVLTAIEEKFTTLKKIRRELELPALFHSLC
jgi:adenylate kinase family enzyme